MNTSLAQRRYNARLKFRQNPKNKNKWATFGHQPIIPSVERSVAEHIAIVCENKAYKNRKRKKAQIKVFNNHL